MRKRIGLAALAAALTAAALTGCGGSGTSGDELVVGLTYIPDIQFAPWYIAEANGHFEREGLDVRLQHHGSSETLFGAIEAGDEDVIIAGSDEMLQARAAGTPLVTFGVVYQEYPVVVIVNEDSGIHSIADLEGTRVGLPGPFGENWFALLALMQNEGLTEDHLTIEYIGYTQQASMVGGDVDAVVGFSNNDLVTFGFAGIPVRAIETGDLPLVGIGQGATDETIAQRSDDLAAFNRAVSAAIQDIKADPEGAVATAFESVDELAVSGDRDAALTILNATIPLYGDGSLSVDADRWPPMYEFMVDAGLAEPGLDPALAVTSELTTGSRPPN
ncbi:MAG TPA: ABC transporter substrate-binding protein [Actinomycetaceae bacterium]|nr:ABC transporter substrate-binding protein [Actinomycetaceae bacterium]